MLIFDCLMDQLIVKVKVLQLSFLNVLSKLTLYYLVVFHNHTFGIPKHFDFIVSKVSSTNMIWVHLVEILVQLTNVNLLVTIFILINFMSSWYFSEIGTNLCLSLKELIYSTFLTWDCTLFCKFFSAFCKRYWSSQERSPVNIIVVGCKMLLDICTSDKDKFSKAEQNKIHYPDKNNLNAKCCVTYNVIMLCISTK